VLRIVVAEHFLNRRLAKAKQGLVAVIHAELDLVRAVDEIIPVFPYRLQIVPVEKTGEGQLPIRPLPRFWKRRWLFGLPLLIVLAVVLSITRHPTTPSKSSYDAYLKATEYLERFDKSDNLDRAVGLLKTAVKSDPDFALAFAYLGEAYRLKARSLATSAPNVWT